MKDAEFIALLNLYLDHEISPADAVRLEAEVQGNPARFRTYQEYCRIQKACKLLAHEFQTEAAPVADGKVVAFRPAAKETKRTGIYVFGLLGAAAACLAIIFVSRTGDFSATGTASALQGAVPSSPSGLSVTTPVSAAATVSDAVAPRAIGDLVRVQPRREPQPMLVGNPLLLSGKVQADAALASAVEQANTQFEWMRTVRLAPIQQSVPMEELSFKAQPTSLQPGSRTYNSSRPLEGGVESVGFSITK